MQVIVPLPDTDAGIWLSSDVGGVQETEAAVVLVAIVPLALPNT